MAKEVGKDIEIINLQESWNGYVRERVEEFIKKYLAKVDKRAGYLVISPEKEDGFFILRGFASQDDYLDWESDKENNDDLVLFKTSLPDNSGNTAVSYEVRLYGSEQERNNITSTDGTVKVHLRFTSQMYSPLTQTKEEFEENALITIQRRLNANASWQTVADGIAIERIDSTSSAYKEIDISQYVQEGTQQIRIRATGESSELGTNWVVYNKVVKTNVYLEQATQWHLPVTDEINLSYYIYGAVEKTLYIRIINGYNEDGNPIYVTKHFSVGESVYVQTPYSQKINITQENLTHGIHTIEAWLQIDGTDTVSETVVTQIMVVRNQTDMTPQVIINNPVKEITNFTQTHLFNWAVYNPTGETSELKIRFTDPNNSETYLEFTESNIEIDGTSKTSEQYSFSSMLEIESTQNELASVVHFYINGEELSDTLDINVDNTQNFAPTGNADFILNPKNRSNSESEPARIINGIDSSLVRAEFSDNFGFLTDGWVEDEDKVRCLRVPAGKTIRISNDTELGGFEPYSDFNYSGNHTKSLTMEFLLKTYMVYDENEPILKVCTYSPDGTKTYGFELKPMSAVFGTTNKNNLPDQDIAFRKEVKTHIAVNVVYNLYNAGLNFVRIFINGVINREFLYESNDTFFSNGIEIGSAKSNSADIDIYSIRVYKQPLSASDIMQDYISTMDTTEEKLAFRDANAILGGDGNISYTLAKEKYNTLLWTGKDLPCYTRRKETDKKDGGNGDLIINIVGDKERSGTINNMTIKGQGTSSMTYWKWNLSFGFSSDSAFINENGENKGQKYQVAEGTPFAKKLVGKLNFASSMQSHKMGSTNAFTDLWKEVVGGNSITKQSGYESVRTAVAEKPFMLFVQNASGNIEFYGLMTFGSGKGDKPTFCGDLKEFKDYIMIEGSDNGKPLTEHRVPWIKEDITWDGDELYLYNGEKNWGLDIFNETDRERLMEYFITAFNFVYLHATNIEAFTGTYTQLKNTANLDTSKQYWTTQNDGESDGKRFDLYRYDFIGKRWVNAGTSKNGDDYSVLNLNQQCIDFALKGDDAYTTPTTNNQNTINRLFISQRVKDFKEHIAEYFNVEDTLYCMMFLKLIAASDNRAKNTYMYLDPITHKICFAQDDLDTIFLTDNVGRKNKPYYAEEHDSDSSGDPYWNGTENVLYNLMEQAYPKEMRDTMKSILTAMAKLGESTMGFFERYYFSTQRYFPCVAYNSIAQSLYEEAEIAMSQNRYSNGTHPIAQSLGDQLQAEIQFIERRLTYFESWCSYGGWQGGENSSGTLNFRSVKTPEGNNPSYSFTLKPYQWLHPSANVGQSPAYYGNGYNYSQRVQADEEFVLSGLTSDGNTNLFIHGADYYKSLGNFGKVSLAGEPAINSKTLEEFTASVESGETMLFRPTGITFVTPAIKKIDLNGVSSLTSGLNLSECTKLEYLDLRGTGIGSVTLPQTDTLKTVYLPSSITNLELRNLPNLTTFEIEGVNNLMTLVVGKNTGNINTNDILQRCMAGNAALDTLQLENIAWSGTDAKVVSYLTTINKASVSGRIIGVSGNISFATKQVLMEQFGNIDDSSNSLYISYNKVTISSVSITSAPYVTDKSQPHTLIVSPDNASANNFKSIEWEMLANDYSEWKNQSKGQIQINITGVNNNNYDEQNGEWSDEYVLSNGQTRLVEPYAEVTVKVTLLDGTVKTATQKIRFYERACHLGDIIYGDGTWADDIVPNKTPIGVCFYINPKNPLDRLMVALQNASSHYWGLYPSDQYGVAGLEFSDGLGSVYDTPVANITSRGFTNKSANALGEAYIDDSVYCESVSYDGVVFKDYSQSPNTAVGDCNFYGNNISKKYENSALQIPMHAGKYKTEQIIEHRNKWLNDENVKLPIPVASEDETEMACLTRLMNELMQAHTGQSNAGYYREYYFPAASFCYAYQPNVKTPEGLAEKFKAHNWWLPSSGELSRIIWYNLHGYDSSVGDKNSIFAKAYELGVMPQLTGWFWSSTEYSSTGAWGVTVYGNLYYYFKYNSYQCRAVVAF